MLQFAKLETTSKCPIKQYKSGKYITGNNLLINENLFDRLKSLESLAKDCQVHVNVKGSYYQLAYPSQQVTSSDVDLVAGHGFKFELLDTDDRMLCNSICLGKSPKDFSEVRCFLNGAASRGWVWGSSSYPTVLSDGFYASSLLNYNVAKIRVQTDCQNSKLKRQLLRALRKLDEEEQESDEKK
ncbi:unnamed protein product [Didymodactylos carnosus]|uniref:Uncharacterized protein n=1 Tax=Didymodactylos carnosus TaxID=1234261 RepID=A0A815MKT6_9BILA|nr:unnamed protein product [Didymodactylos carnosus]CAF1419661.1 unnamed protein product [Didymodactylos carnosus]CAF4216854.1 unnamed protein product [Didymodactylos carnosus]CAF4303561.1 unnamed protein product [Didymodactylos carnosus]